ncbi:MAG: ATP-grasp domain-containing protein [Oscillospiraceae bacterium]|jgi:predicted ATP-grasp superfamily ATP-dependent carboligase|nr:ATP-grasp domain-containing protein [Oscillospiraceae bacterium]
MTNGFGGTVILTDTEYRAATAVARELGQTGYRVVAAYTGDETPLSARSKYVSERVRLDAARELPTDDAYADGILELARRENTVIFPAGARTTRIMAARREEFSRFTLISDAETLKRANDKPTVAAMARELGIRVPETLSLKDADSFNYPVVVKYADGEALGITAAGRYAIARNRAELDAAVLKMQAHPYFISEYIRGAGYGVSVLTDRQRRPVRVFCHERLREYPLTGGPSVACRSVWCENMARDAVRLLQAMNFEGLAMVEFRGTPETYAVLEINPRVWGSYPLSYLAGAGFATAFARAASGEELPQSITPEYKTGVVMQYFISGARWAAASAVAKKSPIPLLKYASDIINPRVRHGLWSARDPKPGLRYLRSLRIFSCLSRRTGV